MTLTQEQDAIWNNDQENKLIWKISFKFNKGEIEQA